MRISSRFGSPQVSFVYGPEPGPAAVAVAQRAVLHESRPALMLRSALHSQRTQTSDRSPLVPRSSIHSCRRQSVCSLWTKPYQSMSPMWPVRQARTKRTGTTGAFLPVVVDELAPASAPCDGPAGASGRSLPGPRCQTSWVMNHSGNCQAVIPVCGRGRVVVVGRRGVELRASGRRAVA